MLYMAVMKILAQADDILQVGQSSNRRGADQNQAMSQLQMLFQGQRAGAKLPPLPFLVTNMIKHAGVSSLKLVSMHSVGQKHHVKLIGRNRHLQVVNE